MNFIYLIFFYISFTFSVNVFASDSEFITKSSSDNYDHEAENAEPVTKVFYLNITDEQKGEIFEAARTGGVHFLEKLNKQEANIKDKNGDTPLHLAVKTKQLSSIIALLNGHAKIDELNNKGKAPFDDIKFDTAWGQAFVENILLQVVMPVIKNVEADENVYEAISNYHLKRLLTLLKIIKNMASKIDNSVEKSPFFVENIKIVKQLVKDIDTKFVTFLELKIYSLQETFFLKKSQSPKDKKARKDITEKLYDTLLILKDSYFDEYISSCEYLKDKGILELVNLWAFSKNKISHDSFRAISFLEKQPLSTEVDLPLAKKAGTSNNKLLDNRIKTSKRSITRR